MVYKRNLRQKKSLYSQWNGIIEKLMKKRFL